ncbi:MAG TPA: TetR/AcrR family transcriptional regulator [Nevskiales bacterium]|nr:TetR/AcrR family transcriptional regulator [Nevskiales bacterium]
MTARGEATRTRLLDAAEQAFGTLGFHNASIADITRTADVGQGTFYLYFQSKEDIFRELVRHMGRKLRAAISQAIADAGPRLQAERVGLEAFLRFVAEHRNLYRVVQESLFVDEASYRAYYEEFAAAYAEALRKAQRAGELRPGHAEARAWALMGLGHFLGLRYCLWDDKGLPPRLMDGVIDFIAHGMAPERK